MTDTATHTSERRCIHTRQTAPRDGLIRFAVSPEGEVVPDLEEKLPGRGLWLTASADIVRAACAENSFSKAARRNVSVPSDLPDRLVALLNRRCLDLIALARKSGAAIAGFEKVRQALDSGDVALLRTTQAMQFITPLKFGDSSVLQPWEPLITIGHPSTMARTGPWVTGVGSFLGADYFTRTSQAYNLPAQRGASGSAVVNLKGELVGQIANGGVAAVAEKSAVLPVKYNLFAVELEVDLLETSPAPYSRYPGIPISSQVSNGAPSNYIKELIDKWAPGELNQ